MPANAADGAQATATLAGLPPGAEVEVWHMGFVGPFREGAPHPSVLDGARKLATVTTDAAGRATIAFEVPVVFDDVLSTHVLWAVLPGGVVVQGLHSWTSQYPTAIRGEVFDEAGSPVDGATVTLVLGGGPGTTAGTFARSMRTRKGRFAFPDVPLPDGGSLTVRRNGWPERTRSLSHQEVIRRWAAAGGEFGTDPVDLMLTAATRRGSALVMDFGGPGSEIDPAAPLYFFSPRALEPAFRTTALAGRVHDDLDVPVPTSEGVVVKAIGTVPGTGDVVVAEAPVRDGRYAFASVPTGGPISLALFAPPRCAARGQREVIALPTGISGREAIADFGGRSRELDPNGRKFPFQRPTPGEPDPCIGTPGGPSPTASAPAP